MDIYEQADGRWAGLDGAALITLIQSGRCA